VIQSHNAEFSFTCLQASTADSTEKTCKSHNFDFKRRKKAQKQI
jgi:hypothetical protein